METMIAAFALALTMTVSAPVVAPSVDTVPAYVHDYDAQLSHPVASGTCLNCGSGSTGSCAKQSGKVRMQCRGSRSSCKKKGCKISGTSSCSSAGNVGKC